MTTRESASSLRNESHVHREDYGIARGFFEGRAAQAADVYNRAGRRAAGIMSLVLCVRSLYSLKLHVKV